ncbi:IS66-like element accessory protein TnpA [Rhodobacter sp. CZR27]|uniref:IS66-like element accessory protein TnpA n=1 Tax=Rhodobacter sp. CZR27 TaxID=2033869 RepID=UPI0012FDF495|nr:transposase [Rhodobacter sp. CZR27]
MDGSPVGFAGRLEVVEGSSGRRRWSDEEKARIASESYRPGVHVADVARRYGTTRWQIYDWRRRLAKGLLALPAEVGPRSVFAAVVVDPDVARLAPAAMSEGGVVALVVDGITIRASQHIDEAHLVRVIRAARMAAR